MIKCQKKTEQSSTLSSPLNLYRLFFSCPTKRHPLPHNDLQTPVRAAGDKGAPILTPTCLQHRITHIIRVTPVSTSGPESMYPYQVTHLLSYTRCSNRTGRVGLGRVNSGPGQNRVGLKLARFFRAKILTAQPALKTGPIWPNSLFKAKKNSDGPGQI